MSSADSFDIGASVQPEDFKNFDISQTLESIPEADELRLGGVREEKEKKGEKREERKEEQKLE